MWLQRGFAQAEPACDWHKYREFAVSVRPTAGQPTRTLRIFPALLPVRLRRLCLRRMLNSPGRQTHT